MMPPGYKHQYWPTYWERFLWWAFGIHWSRKWIKPKWRQKVTFALLFRVFFVTALTAGLVLSIYIESAGWSGLFGLLLGTALERLLTRT